MKKLLFVCLMISLLSACSKEDTPPPSTPTNQNASIGADIQNLIAGKTIGSIYMNSVGTNTVGTTIDNPIITFNDNFLVVNGLYFVALDKITKCYIENTTLYVLYLAK